MVQTLSAKDITLRQLETEFNLVFIENNQFFGEWQNNLTPITDLEKQQLDRVKTNYINLIKFPPMLEDTVKMVVLSPLLDLAGFYASPFHIKAEQSVEISAENNEVILKGKIDILVFKEHLWIVVIESKQPAFSIEVGLPQILAYMLGNPNTEKPSFGMITTGGSFIFLKLIQGKSSQYTTSKVFELRNPGNDLYAVLSILKGIGNRE
ncbi:MAG: restriction endonuclease subunit R [Microcystaceae cyanobacterium]